MHKKIYMVTNWVFLGGDILLFIACIILLTALVVSPYVQKDNFLISIPVLLTLYAVLLIPYHVRNLLDGQTIEVEDEREAS